MPAAFPPFQFTSPPVRPLARIPVWVWPMVAVTALLAGLLGGVFGGVVAATVLNKAGNGLRLEPRTSAPLPEDNTSVPKVAEKLLPSTVQIIAEYAGDPRGATGSGWVLDDQGHVITNNHVVAEAAADGGSIDIVDSLGRHTPAIVVGRSAVYDIAVLKSKGAKKLRPAAVGASGDLHVGETVVAIGSPLGLSSSVTSGIVSALNRPVTTGDSAKDNSFINAVQTDAAINPGNSGGPLVDLSGRVIGVNSAIATLGGGRQSGNIGVGFAIPIEQVLTTADQIVRTGKARYPIIGANVRTPTSVEGARIVGVTAGGPAQKAGMRRGDLITSIDGRPVTDTISLIVAIRSHVKGDHVVLTVLRSNQDKEFAVVLDAVVDNP